MPNNPVQIVLNAQNYVQQIEVTPGGSNKDFYAGRDPEFVAHKRRIAEEVANLEAAMAKADVGLQYACVELKDEGWAKSHRPNRQLFPSSKIRTIGGDDLGSVVIEVTVDDVRELPRKIASAESQTNWVLNDRTQRKEARPSRLRSEVGAISKIRLYGPEDRRKFNLEQALDWLSDPRTGGAYYVETFVPSRDALAKFPSDHRRELAGRLLEDFERRLAQVSEEVQVSKVQTHWTPGLIYVVKVADPPRSDAGRELHRRLLAFLDQHPAVRAILLPPVLQSSARGASGEVLADVPEPEEDNYPIVGIIDTGVSAIGALPAWSAGGVNFIADENQDRYHGTFIAGLLAAGSVLNAGEPFDERPCRYFDLGLHPTSNYRDYYPRGFLDFLEQLDAEIRVAKATGVRIYNMSLSVTLPVEDANYSLFAHALDKIADEHGVLFVLPAGNLDGPLWRATWPQDADDCLQMLAEYRHQGRDRIFQPADSLRSLVVGALEPPDGTGRVRPSRYTRRGPGPSLGAKPDVAHVGGRGAPDHGLVSIAPDGTLTASSGTSFAAPLVAKTLAVIDRAIAGEASLETLCALAIHGASLPEGLEHRKLETIAKDFVGAGTPKRAASCLEADDSQITLVFDGALHRGAGLSFDFRWPASLVSEHGACRGHVQLTTVYRPPIDRDFGAEFVLVNIDSWLRQANVDAESGEITYANQLKSRTEYGIEKERVIHGAKWWPVKRFAQTFPRGIGRSSEWRLVLEPLCRADFALTNDQTVPFCTILTISDPTGEADIFNEVRQELQANGVQIADIRVALSPQIRARAGGGM